MVWDVELERLYLDHSAGLTQPQKDGLLVGLHKAFDFFDDSLCYEGIDLLIKRRDEEWTRAIGLDGARCTPDDAADIVMVELKKRRDRDAFELADRLLCIVRAILCGKCQAMVSLLRSELSDKRDMAGRMP